jgi:peptidoglycan/xylan/chitin deacetylase (PgdA/CDA1 family)
VRALAYARRVAVLCVSAGVLGLRRLADLARRLAGRPPRARCVALYYHGLPDRRRADFAWQMDEILRCAKPLRAEARQAPDRGGLRAIVTFDDGFRSFSENALPELAERGIPAALFVIPAALFVPAGNLGRAPEWLAGSGHADSRETVLGAEELRGLPAGLVTVGSHTLTHAPLSGLGEADARRELVESRATLERLLGRRVTLLSLPHGSFDARVLELAREAEYERVFTVSPSLAEIGNGAFIAGRCRVGAGDWRIEFRLKVRGAYSWMARASAVKRALLRLLPRKRSAA